jgi:DNA-binding SARP family transcriptional activator
MRWVVELAAAGRAAGNPPPDALLDAVGPAARAELRTLAASAPRAIADAAKDLMRRIPKTPSFTLRISVLGPLALSRDGEVVSHPHLRRQRVCELLCLLAARRRMRREELAFELWPEHDDPSRNLRTTLNYAQQLLESEREEGELPYFLRSDGSWLALTGEPWLQLDTDELLAHLDAADAAERDHAPAAALVHYRAALPLWRGEPYADALGMWVNADRSRLLTRYTDAAVRAGELLLAAGDTAAARDAAQHSIAADKTDERAYRLLARTHLAENNAASATRAIDACRAALAELGVEPDPATLALATAQ